jgi:uncharacterized flavoprotein (TIGR03862 family)
MSIQAEGTVAILGTGPAGLMAASRAAQAGLRVRLFDKRKGPGRKLLVAGSSGLNITYECSEAEFAAHYRGSEQAVAQLARALGEFSPKDWRGFIEKELGIATFLGTSRRWFVATEGMKASSLLKAWVEWLERRGARIELGREVVDFECRPRRGVSLAFADGGGERVDAACFCLGGGSWEPSETPLRWPGIFERKGIPVRPFEASNVGFQVAWPPGLLAEAEGKPVKNVVLSSSRGRRAGDLVITRYGIEGTPVYFAGEVGTVRLDLKPDLTLEQVRSRLALVKENLSPIRRAKRCLKLGDGALALLYHLGDARGLAHPEELAARIKAFPLELLARQPLAEAISSSGGLDWEELDEGLMLRRFPGVFVAGEMLDWDAPTGGFLIQGCVSLGSLAGARMSRYASALTKAVP